MLNLEGSVTLYMYAELKQYSSISHDHYDNVEVRCNQSLINKIHVVLMRIIILMKCDFKKMVNMQLCVQNHSRI